MPLLRLRRTSALIEKSKKLMQKGGLRSFKKLNDIDVELKRRYDNLGQKSELSEREKRNFRIIREHLEVIGKK